MLSVISTGGNGNGTGPFPSVFLLKVLREAQFWGKFIFMNHCQAARGQRYGYVHGSHIVCTCNDSQVFTVVKIEAA